MSLLRRNLKFSLLCFLFLRGAAPGADIAELKVMTSGAFTAAYRELVPQFEAKAHLKVVSSYGASMGGAPDSIPVRIERGEPVDVVILARAALEELVKQGKVRQGSCVDLVRSDIGMAVRAGAPKPDIGTLDALKRTLLEAKSIAYSDSASGVYLSTQLFQRLGIADQILPKSQRTPGQVGVAIARGDAEIGFQQISELLPVPGIDVVGPLPPGAQKISVFSAGIAVNAQNPEAAKKLIEFLASPASAAAIRKSGLEPIR
jgi:molybdate transport system substrate-binding protein